MSHAGLGAVSAPAGRELCRGAVLRQRAELVSHHVRGVHGDERDLHRCAHIDLQHSLRWRADCSDEGSNRQRAELVSHNVQSRHGNERELLP